MRHVAESLAATLVFLLAALAWVSLVTSLMPDVERNDPSALKDRLGLPMSLFVVALCPGIFEEIAFRGMIQGRISRLLGATQGALVTGAVFALAHGITLGFPVHVGLGMYLCFLRLRSNSLLPGMILHMLYNGSLIILDLA